MSIDFLLAAFDAYGAKKALVWKERSFDYAWLAAETRRQIARLDTQPGEVVGLRADYSPRGLAILLALLERRAIVAPLTPAFDREREGLWQVAEVGTEIALDDDDGAEQRRIGHMRAHPLLDRLAREGAPGLVLFSSGSEGKSKAIVHHGLRLLEKYRTPRRASVTIPFMLFDHIGGINTVLHVLSSGGTAVLPRERSPEAIARLIAANGVQVLPTTPTFLNLLLLRDPEARQLASLEILAYGAERMPAATLERLREVLPRVSLVQNYGMSEVGILQTKSEASGSLWVKLGGDGYETRVVDGLLEIKARSAMLGYLNEASPFTEDGWLRTGDRVEARGEWVRILGRASDLIIVGGEKVYPAEVEDLIASMPGVVEVIVGAEPNAITGNLVKADVRLATDETRAQFKKRMSDFLGARLASYKVPQRVVLHTEPLHGARMKKPRVVS